MCKTVKDFKGLVLITDSSVSTIRKSLRAEAVQCYLSTRETAPTHSYLSLLVHSSGASKFHGHLVPLGYLFSQRCQAMVSTN